jgi:glycerophosphoryl diester phosphodiesterase
MQNKSAPILIAHRGASFDAPENTLAAFQLGLDQGADAIECDVHLSSDGGLVVIHDADLRRTAGIDRAVKEMTMTELKAPETGIPTLASVLALVPHNRRIFIEIKVGLPAIAPLEKLLAETPLPMSQIVLMEFDLDTAIALKKTFPAAEVLWLNEFPRLSIPRSRRSALSKILGTARQHGLNGVNLQNIPQLNAEFIRSCHTQALSCYCWTVDDPHRASALIKNGIGGIATNRPGWMREQLIASGTLPR